MPSSDASTASATWPTSTSSTITDAVNPVESVIVVPVTIGSNGTTLYVDDDAPPGGDGLSWDTAYADLQDALDHTLTNEAIAEVRVAGGVYRPDRGTFDQSRSFHLVGGVTVRG